MNAITEGKQHKGGRNLSEPTPRPDPPEAQTPASVEAPKGSPISEGYPELNSYADEQDALNFMRTEEPDSYIKIGVKEGEVVKVDWPEYKGAYSKDTISELLGDAILMVNDVPHFGHEVIVNNSPINIDPTIKMARLNYGDILKIAGLKGNVDIVFTAPSIDGQRNLTPDTSIEVVKGMEFTAINKVATFMVNGDAHECLENTEYSYRDVCKMAFPDRQQFSGFSVAVDHPEKQSSILVRDKTVEVVDGMRFEIARTG